jgi:hypothetical protein
MKRKLLIAVLIACIVVCISCGVWWGYPALLNTLHGQELERALQRYWNVYNSPQVFENPGLLSEVMTGELLTNTMTIYRNREEPPRHIPCKVTIQSVKEYSGQCSRVSAQVTCGSGLGAFSGNTGQYILLWEESRWKVASFWQWIDNDDMLWPSSPPPTCEDLLE